MQTRTVSNVAVSGNAVLLTLDAGAEHLEAGILVSYTPGTNPIRDVPGNEAEALSRESVTNETPGYDPAGGGAVWPSVRTQDLMRLIRRGTRSR